MAKKSTKNAVVAERLQNAAGNVTKIMGELRDETNDLNMMNQAFPLVGCDRRAPPAKVGIVMSRDKLSINAYSNGEATSAPNTLVIDWNEVSTFKSQKDGLQVIIFYRLTVCFKQYRSTCANQGIFVNKLFYF